MDDWVSGAISGAAGLIGSGINYFAQQSANETNLQVARENRDFYYQQWQRENAYNDPSAVMQRLSRAGLNPNLMYGEGTGGLAASATMQNVDPGRVSSPTVDPYLMAQIGLMTAQTEKTKTDADKSASDIRVNEGVVKVNESVALYNSALTNFTKAQQDLVVGQTRMLGSQMDQINANIAKTYAEIRQLSKDNYFRSVELSIKSKEVDSLCEKYASETGLNKEQLKYVGVLAMSKVRALDADALLKAANIELTQKQAEQCHAATQGLTISNLGAAWNLNLDLKFGETDRRLKQSQAAAEVLNVLMDAGAWHLGPAGKFRAANGDILYQNFEALRQN